MCAGGDDNKGEYKQYNAGQMALAVQSRGTMSVRKLADYWGLPRTSLRREIDKQSAEVVPAVAHVAGGQQVLSLAAEDALVRQIELAALHSSGGSAHPFTSHTGLLFVCRAGGAPPRIGRI